MAKKSLVPPGLRYLADNIQRKDNLLGVSKSEGARWAAGLNLPKRGETIFFAGCGYQFDHKLEALMNMLRRLDRSFVGLDNTLALANLQKQMKLDGLFLKTLGLGEDGQPLRAAVAVLRRLGISPAYLAEDEPCCGGLLHFMGAAGDFKSHSGSVNDRLKAAGVSRIISIVPSCTYTLKNLIVGTDGQNPVTVSHFSEVVAENIGQLKLRFPESTKVTYHDPCQLVRYLNLADQPRTIIRAIKNLELVEPKWTRCEFATCCGGGGGFEAVYPEMSEMLAKNRVRELLETGASLIVTHCPGCIMQIKTGLKALKADKVAVLDLAELVARSLEE
ncbi:MAG TPA: (Fe-S)-binding protein [Dehalococcoidales bacterium]|nr:(Fe-S)-binding protein [Dehalococcoidales bacterium]